MGRKSDGRNSDFTVGTPGTQVGFFFATRRLKLKYVVRIYVRYIFQHELFFVEIYLYIHWKKIETFCLNA
jgi:hypothetical protein